VTIVKICGITNLDDALAAVDCGVDMLGFVFAGSPRRVSPETAAGIIASLTSEVKCVGVFVDADIERVRGTVDLCSLDMVQLHGNETPEYAQALSVPFIKAFRTRDDGVLGQIGGFGAETFLLDSYDPGRAGGTGELCDWTMASEAAKLGRMILAGGLNPENVARAIKTVKPYGVDVSSGIEISPGRKDHEKMREFVMRVRKCRCV
jgi:phosphoribosylanthranilate isomerase